MICRVVWEKNNGEQIEQGGLSRVDALTLLTGISEGIGPEPDDLAWVQIELDSDYIQ